MEALKVVKTFAARSYAEVQEEARLSVALRCQAALKNLNAKLLEKKLHEQTYFGMFRVVPAKVKKSVPVLVSGNAKVSGDAKASGDALVSGKAVRKVCAMFDYGEFYAIADNKSDAWVTVAPYYATKAEFFRNAHKRGYTHVDISGKVSIIPAKYRA